MSTRKFFGTDGVRGRANTYPITAEVALRIGMAAGRYFKRGNHKHRVVIGKDTRRSSYMLETALMSGFSAMGVDVYTLGPVPTPAVGMLVKSLRADVGVMISASHNPHYDNGIKLFGPDGYKLSDEVEAEIERFLDEDAEPHLPDPITLGSMKRLDDGAGRYTEMAKATLPRELRFDGLKIVVDCAHGAAYRTAPAMLWELGADVETIGVAPNGFNINDGCGSTAPKRCQQAVIEHDADLGIALDGDADRVHVIDEKGQIVDGDQIMALIASSWARQGRLKGGALVSTIMSNMGLERRLADDDINLLRTKVGDRYVVAKMRERGCNIGGEQSGHIVLNDFTTTGDGTIAALQVLAELRSQGRRASEVCRMFEPVPQLLRNVRFGAGEAPLENADVKAAIKAGQEALGKTGRVVIRKSGTEPLIRVMAEGEDSAQIEQVVSSICHAVTGTGDRMAAE